MDLIRRELLKGLIMSASFSAGTVLVRLAKPNELQALTARGPEVVLANPLPEIPAFVAWNLGSELFAKDADGKMVTVGYITELGIGSDMREGTTPTGTHHTYEQTVRELHGRFRGVFHGS